SIEMGHFFFAANIDAFTTLDEFKKSSGDIMRELRGSKKAEGHDRVFVAGEKEFDNYHRQLAQGGVLMDPVSAKGFITMRAETGLTHYVFPWDGDVYKEKVLGLGEEGLSKEEKEKKIQERIVKLCLNPKLAAVGGTQGACLCHKKKD
ncbi:MAG: hypothetical protein EZS28_012974, partial [Streblomastix strix]